MRKDHVSIKVAAAGDVAWALLGEHDNHAVKLIVAALTKYALREGLTSL